MPAYSKEIRAVGRNHTMVAIKEQIINRIKYLTAQKRELGTSGVLVLNSKTLTAIDNRLSELDLLVEAIDSWME